MFLLPLIRWRINPADIEKFVPIEAVASEVTKLDMDALTEQQKRVVAAFKPAKAKRDAGKPNDDFFDRNDED